MEMTQVNRKAMNLPYEVQIGALTILTWDLDVGQFRFHWVDRFGNIIDSILNGLLVKRDKVDERRDGHRIFVAGEVTEDITRNARIRGGSRHEFQECRTAVRHVLRVEV
jgi:hypothetical protein